MSRLVEALKKVGQTFNLFQKGEIGPCDSTPLAVPIPNLVPSAFCRIPVAAPVPVEEAPAVVEGAVPEVEGAVPEEPEEIDPSAPDLQIDPQDQRIDVRAKSALQRMLKVPVIGDPDMAKNAARLIRGINSGTLEGIFGDDLDKAVKVAREHGTERWLLVPKGEDAALVLDKEKPLKGLSPPDNPPTVIFKEDISKQPGRLDEALKEAGQTFELWQQEELGSGDNTRWIVPVMNLVPLSYCTSMGIPSGTSACSTLKRPEILDYFDQGKSDLKLSHKRKISVIARCVKDRHGTPHQIDTISLIGHASTEGDPSFNEILGQQRAEEVRKDLVIALDREMPGLSSEIQIDTQTRGPRESRNLGPEKDRRVEVFMPHKAVSTACELLVIVTTAEAGHEGAFVEGATVEVTGPLISEKLIEDTNELGQALFQDIEPGTYHVTGRKEGFEEADAEVIVGKDQDQADLFTGAVELPVERQSIVQLNLSSKKKPLITPASAYITPKAGKTIKIKDVIPIVHGDSAFNELKNALYAAEEIYLITWMLEPKMELTRIHWDQPVASLNRSSEKLDNILIELANKGAIIRVIVWDLANVKYGLFNNVLLSLLGPTATIVTDYIKHQYFGKIKKLNESLQLINKQNEIVITPHPGPYGTNITLPGGFTFESLGSHHQKIWITHSKDSLKGFVGGMNLRQHDWDTQAHDPLNPRRNPAEMEGKERKENFDNNKDAKHKTRHDWALKVEGFASDKLLEEFLERWKRAHPQTEKKLYFIPSAFMNAPREHGATIVQVSHTWPKSWNGGSKQILEAYKHALNMAKHYIYIENQYWTNEELTSIIATRLTAMPALQVIIVVPDKAEDPGIGPYIAAEQWYQLSNLKKAGGPRVNVYTLFIQHPLDSARYDSIYVHSKIAIIDDLWMTIGSANTNNRSMWLDTECNIQVAHGPTVSKQRKMAWKEMLGPRLGGDEDPIKVIKEGWIKIGESNMQKMGDGEPLEGMIVPLEEPDSKDRPPQVLRRYL